MPAVFKLMKHDNQHGYGVSLVKYEAGELVGGFVLDTFDSPERREEYTVPLAEMTGFEIEAL